MKKPEQRPEERNAAGSLRKRAESIEEPSMKINENYKNLAESYLFSTIAKKVNEYSAAHPEAKIIRMREGSRGLCEGSKRAGRCGCVPWLWSGTGL